MRSITRWPLLAVLSVALLPGAPAQGAFEQLMPKLVGEGASGKVQGGYSVALSSDASTLAVGGPRNDQEAGCVWMFVRRRFEHVWTQQGPALRGAGAVGAANQGISVALSASGDRLAVGGWLDNSSVGAVWVWQRFEGSWSQFGDKLVGSGSVRRSHQGYAVAMSGDGAVIAFGGRGDNGRMGASWVFALSEDQVWRQRGSKLVGAGAVGAVVHQGNAVSLSYDGSVLAIGGYGDNDDTGATWVFERAAGREEWLQQGVKLVGAAGGASQQGVSVAISADGSVLLVGSPGHNGGVGGAWLFERVHGSWQQRSAIVGAGAVGLAGQGFSVALSSDGGIAAVGGDQDNHSTGATWVFARARGASAWVQTGKFVGNGTSGDIVQQGTAVALSGDGSFLAVGGDGDAGSLGATWLFADAGIALDFAIAVPSIAGAAAVALLAYLFVVLLPKLASRARAGSRHQRMQRAGRRHHRPALV